MIVVCKEKLYYWIHKGCDPQQEVQLLVIYPRDCLASSLVTWMMGQGAPSTSLLIIQKGRSG